jgi:glycosyltransferase involved in cell wall biosynthesis
MTKPEIALLVSSFERPRHLRRALVSIAHQRDVAGKFEVVVTDDGSRDETAAVVEKFARQVDFPVRWTTHAHDGFRLAQCRNEGVAASSAPYLLFLDGDCLLPPDHVAQHLEHQLPRVVWAGDCHQLDRETSEHITEEDIAAGTIWKNASRSEKSRLRNKAARSFFYRLMGHRLRPRLCGNNIGIWRADFERVNGFDENFIGWGLEDRDLQRRLSRIGVRFRSILPWTSGLHLWHEPHPTARRNSEGTKNLEYFHRPDVPTRCECGLQKPAEKL